MNGDGHSRTTGDRGDTTGCQLILCLFAHIDITRNLSASARIDDVLRDLRIADYGRVLLTRADGGAVPSECLVHCPLLSVLISLATDCSTSIPRKPWLFPESPTAFRIAPWPYTEEAKAASARMEG